MNGALSAGRAIPQTQWESHRTELCLLAGARVFFLASKQQRPCAFLLCNPVLQQPRLADLPLCSLYLHNFGQVWDTL